MADASDTLSAQVVAMDAGRLSAVVPSGSVEIGDIPAATRTALAADAAFTGAFPPILIATAVKTADYTAKIGELVPVNATGGNVTVTLPTGATAGQRVAVTRTDGTANTVAVARGGSDTIASGLTTVTSHNIVLQDRSIVFISNGAGAWRMGYGYQSLTSLDARYLPVASGTATLVGGVVTVTDANTTANSVIRLSYKTVGGTPGAVFIQARTAGASFQIKSTSGTDTSVISYEILTY